MGPSSTTSIDLSTVNRMDRAAFVNAFGDVFEHSPWVADRAWSASPFASISQLHQAMIEVVEEASRDEQFALLRAHPELAGREAESGTLTRASTSEQSTAGLSDLSADEAKRIKSLNAAYREKFGFPFIIAVRYHDKTSIFGELEGRLNNDGDTELANNLTEIYKITALRLDDLVSDRSRSESAAAG